MELYRVSDEEHEVNQLMLSLSDEQINKVISRIRANKHIGEGSNSCIEGYTYGDLKRIIIDFHVNRGLRNLNDLFFAVYAIHNEWWEWEGKYDYMY